MRNREIPYLISIDVQEGFHSPFWGPRNNPDVEFRIEEALNCWRLKKWPVLHIQHLSDHHESPLYLGKPATRFMKGLEPLPNERVIQKSVNSAFIGTGLKQLLEAEGTKSLVLIGFTADHCVSTTARMASNLGFDVTLVSDAMATFDRRGGDGTLYPAELVHQVSLASLQNEFARVMDLNSVLTRGDFEAQPPKLHR